MSENNGKKKTEITVKQFDEQGRSIENKYTADRFFLVTLGGEKQQVISSLSQAELALLFITGPYDFIIEPRMRAKMERAMQNKPKIIVPKLGIRK